MADIDFWLFGYGYDMFELVGRVMTIMLIYFDRSLIWKPPPHAGKEDCNCQTAHISL